MFVEQPCTCACSRICGKHCEEVLSSSRADFIFNNAGSCTDVSIYMALDTGFLKNKPLSCGAEGYEVEKDRSVCCRCIGLGENHSSSRLPIVPLAWVCSCWHWFIHPLVGLVCQTTPTFSTRSRSHFINRMPWKTQRSFDACISSILLNHP